MNILVINISLRPESQVMFFPIGLGYITTAMNNAGFDFDLIDIDANRYSEEYVEKEIRSKKYDIVCMGCIVTGYKKVKSLSALIKMYHPRCKIIVGNSVATSIVSKLFSKTDIDIAVMGEGDETIVELLETISESRSLDQVRGIYYREGKGYVKTQIRPLIKNISSIQPINYDIFDVERYIENSKLGVTDPLPIPRDTVRALPVNTARGCIANCTFCYHVFKGHPYRYRSSDSIVNEIKSLISKYDLNYIQFWDELTFFSKKQALELSQKIIDTNLSFYWDAQCRANLFSDDSDIAIMEKMKTAGCIGMQYSLESANESILKDMNKKISVDQFSKQTSLFQKAGIATLTSLVIGYPQETNETIKQTFDCCLENKIYPSVGYLLPQPGSSIYEYAVEHGYIDDEEKFLLKMGDRQDLRINMTNMNDEQLKTTVLNCLKKCNEILKIGLDPDKLIKTQYWRAANNKSKADL